MTEPKGTDRLAPTRRAELIRGAMTGPIQAAALGTGAFQVVVLLHFDAGTFAKGLIAGSLHGGLLLTPLAATVVSLLRIPVAKAMAILLAIAGVGLGVAAFADSLSLFLLGVLSGMPAFAAIAPFVTALWQQNAPAKQRGRFFSQTYWVATIAGIGSTSLIAWWFGDDPSRFMPVMLGLSLCLFISAFVLLFVPSEPLARGGRNPLARLSLLWKRPLFGYISAAWMLIGLANLSTIPLRTEYLGNPVYGQNYDSGTILLIVSVTADCLTLASMMMWGRLFDRMNFLVLRIIINVAFGLSIVLFFIPNIWAQIAGSIFFGIGRGGGSVAWNLWVTKFAPPEETADYMSVHTFLTGIRGLLGPQIALWTAAHLSLHAASWSATALIVISCVMLVPMIKYGRQGMNQ